jgi:YceI-like domain
MTTLDASAVECHLFTFKEGALSALAHDLELEVERLTIELGEPSEPSPADGTSELTISARFYTDSIGVLHAVKDGKPTTQLSDSDRRKIERTIATDVLDVRRFPDVRFTGNATLSTDARAAIPITGELLLQGRRRAISTHAHRDGDRLRIELTLHQPDFGIAPYSALLGTLKIRPDIKVRLSLPWPLDGRL